MGVGHVAYASRATDARRLLENRSFDVVLCDYHFDHSAMSGQDLLDDLRRSNLLPYATVFVMVTGEASYGRVAEAAEAALDSYLLKPHTATALEQRVLQARHRKKVLGPIFEAIAEEDFASAAQLLCQARFEQRGEYWLYAARVGAELWVRLNELENARALYEAVRARRAPPWAKLGIARVELESGQLQQATRTLESLIGEQPTYADAYDVMGRVQVEQGDMAAALETHRSATELTPASVSRLQKQGMLAFYMGERDEATEALEAHRAHRHQLEDVRPPEPGAADLPCTPTSATPRPSRAPSATSSAPSRSAPRARACAACSRPRASCRRWSSARPPRRCRPHAISRARPATTTSTSRPRPT